MAKRRRTKSFFSLSKLLMVLGLVLLVGAAVWAFAFREPEDKSATADITSSGAYINLDPPTEEEKQETEAHKRDLANKSDSPAPPPASPSGKTQVTPTITSVTKTEVRGFVSGVREDGGTCTVTLTKGSSSITKSSTGVGDASYTNCPPIALDSALSEGTWSVVLSYSSAKAEGQSQSKTYKVE